LQIKRVSNNNPESTLKFLGIHMDENLTWKTHVNKVKSKISYAIFIMNKVKNILPYTALKTLYLTLVQSHLIYGILAWGNSAMINKTALLQKKAIRIINNKHYRAHTDPLYKTNNILKLVDLHENQILLFMYEYMNNQLPLPYENLFDCQNPPCRITRHSENIIYREMPRIKFTECLPRHNFRIVLNKLDDDIKNTSNKMRFKMLTKLIFINKYAESIHCDNPYCTDCS
jgi:hypothetical protein